MIDPLRDAAEAIARTAARRRPAARWGIAQAAVGACGNYSWEAKGLWRDYIAAGCPQITPEEL